MNLIYWKDSKHSISTTHGDNVKTLGNRNRTFRSALWNFLALLLFLVFTLNYARAEKSAYEKIKEQYFLLGLVGYNYTDRNISNYSVNSAGGANIRLSSPTGGGSGITCCVRLAKNKTTPFRVKVRWQYDGCIYLIRDDRTGKADQVRHYYYKEAEVEVQRADSGTPGYIETHFYPDGSVQVVTTDYFSDPHLARDPKRVDQSPTELVSDLPGGQSRLLQRANGIPHVFVNGRAVIAEGKPTGDLAGRVLRRFAS